MAWCCFFLYFPDIASWWRCTVHPVLVHRVGRHAGLGIRRQTELFLHESQFHRAACKIFRVTHLSWNRTVHDTYYGGSDESGPRLAGISSLGSSSADRTGWGSTYLAPRWFKSIRLWPYIYLTVVRESPGLSIATFWIIHSKNYPLTRRSRVYIWRHRFTYSIYVQGHIDLRWANKYPLWRHR